MTDFPCYTHAAIQRHYVTCSSSNRNRATSRCLSTLLFTPWLLSVTIVCVLTYAALLLAVLWLLLLAAGTS